MNTRGFTLIELITVFGIIATLSGILIISLSPRHRGVSLVSAVSQVIADMQSQQTKAMADAGSYGIYIRANQYVLFKGVNYSESEPTNAVFTNPPHILFSDIRLPTSSVVFTQGSGEVAGYSLSENFVTVRHDISGETKTFSINRYGIVTSVE